MPSKTEKQKKFFGAVMGAKKGQEKVSGKAKKVAKDMPKKEIKKFLKKEGEEDEQSLSKQMQKSGKITMTGPKVKERKKFAPPTKVEKPKKGRGSYERKEKFTESALIQTFIDAVFLKDYTKADECLKTIVNSKMSEKIKSELKTPLF